MNNNDMDEIPDEVDFTGGARGHFAGRFSREAVAAVIEPGLLKKAGKAEDGEVRAEYDFSKARRNPHAERANSASPAAIEHQKTS